jgi:GNAT superfamily N-acetyltransferase
VPSPQQAPLPTQPIRVASSRSWGDLRRFIGLPFRLHAGTPWIPPLRLERWMFLNRRLNAYFKHGRAQYFLAWRGDRVVGRVSAQVDDAFNAFHQSRWGMFGFLEFEDDPQVLHALLDAAQQWLREQGCDRMVGPMDFTMNDESGVLVEGHELEPLVKQPWHPPYYQQRLEEAGMAKAMDLLSWDLDVSDRDKLMKLLVDVGQRAETEHRIKIRPMSLRRLRRELDAFADVYNSAWSGNWGFVPYSKADLDAYALELRLVHSPGWFMIAERDGETVAMAITVMDINQVLKRMKGRLLPLGWWHYLRRHHTVDRLRVGFLGVKPEFQHTGAGAALFLAHFDNAQRSPLKHGEAGWILETNRSMNRGLKAMNGRIVKRYRVYERPL